jgi:hypothetical protein
LVAQTTSGEHLKAALIERFPPTGDSTPAPSHCDDGSEMLGAVSLRLPFGD